MLCRNTSPHRHYAGRKRAQQGALTCWAMHIGGCRGGLKQLASEASSPGTCVFVCWGGRQCDCTHMPLLFTTALGTRWHDWASQIQICRMVSTSFSASPFSLPFPGSDWLRRSYSSFLFCLWHYVPTGFIASQWWTWDDALLSTST